MDAQARRTARFMVAGTTSDVGKKHLDVDALLGLAGHGVPAIPAIGPHA
ncbi:hypothetical protein OG559_22890 [Micromonospora sp. NBC_01405]